MVTAVLFSQNAGTNTITTFHDMISNELPQLLGTWNFDLKIFLNNKNSKPKNIAAENVPNRYLYTLQLSYLPGNQMITIINNSKSITTTIPSNSNTLGQNNSGRDSGSQSAEEKSKMAEKLRQHVEKGGCSNWSGSNVGRSVEQFDYFLQNKLQSMWNLKQTIRGEAGYGYIVSIPGITEGKLEKFKLRTSNCFLQGVFKGFLIEIEHIDESENEEDGVKKEEKNGDAAAQKNNELIMKFTYSITKIRSLITMYKFPEGKLFYNVLSDSKLDYLSDLCQQYCDALQF